MSKSERFYEDGSVIYDKNLQITYLIKSYLGRGAFAQCYLVSIESGAEFALKVISLNQEENVIRKIESEIHIHKSLNHPNIVRMYTEFRDEKYVYMVMELCTNKTLNELLKRKGRLEVNYVIKYTNQIVMALEYLHESLNVVHRDLKLGNLFLDQNFDLKIGDFGLSAKIKPGQKKNTICGTPNYIAPEVLFDKENGHSYEVDIWSLGVIIYTLLVGVPPFQKKNVKEIYKNIQRNRYTYPSDFEISDSARNLIDSILTTNPMDRLTLNEIKNHPFLQEKLSLPEKVYRNIKEGSFIEEECKQDHLIFTIYSNKLDGLGYILLSGPGIFFNDGTTMISRDSSIIYIDVIKKNNKRYYKKEQHLNTKIPDSLNLKYQKLTFFIKNFCNNFQISDVEPTFVVKMKKTDFGFWYQLWNGILIFEIGNKKVIVYDEGRKIHSVVDGRICRFDDEMKNCILSVVNQYR